MWCCPTATTACATAATSRTPSPASCAKSTRSTSPSLWKRRISSPVPVSGVSDPAGRLSAASAHASAVLMAPVPDRALGRARVPAPARALASVRAPAFRILAPHSAEIRPTNLPRRSPPSPPRLFPPNRPCSTATSCRSTCPSSTRASVSNTTASAPERSSP